MSIAEKSSVYTDLETYRLELVSHEADYTKEVNRINAIDKPALLATAKVNYQNNLTANKVQIEAITADHSDKITDEAAEVNQLAIDYQAKIDAIE